MDLLVHFRMDRVPPGTQIPFELWVGGQLEQTSSVATTQGETEVHVKWTPKRGGLERLEIRLLPGDLIEDRSRLDDVAETSVQVRAEPIPVLLLGGLPGPDLGFLRRILAADPRFQVAVRSGFDKKTPIVLPSSGDEFSLERVPLVVLAGFSQDLFPEAVQRDLEQFLLQQRGALLLLSNGPREWRHLFASRLAPYLPLRKQSREVQSVEKRFGVDSIAVNSHPVTRVLDHPQANRQAWQRLPPITPGGRLQIVSGSRVLLGFPNYPKPIPLLSIRSVQGGMVLAINSRETYLWNLLAKAHGDPENLHERFFARLIAWAADPTREGGERLEVSKLRFVPGEKVRVRWRGQAGKTVPKHILLESLVPSGKSPSFHRTIGLGSETSGEGHGEFEAPAPGFYTLRASEGDAEPLSLAVHASREEEAQLDADPSTLKRIAEVSGGRYLALSGRGPLEGLPSLDTTPVVRHHTTGIYWLDEPKVLALCLLLFCLEWGLRRRRSLV
jgi:hypothetical protein